MAAAQRPQRPRFFAFIRRLVGVLILLLALGGVGIALVSIEEHVGALGEVRPLVDLRLHSLVDSVVLEVLVDDGDEVKKGDLLMQLDDVYYRDSLARQRASLVLKQADLLVAEKSLASLRVAPLPEAYRFTELGLDRAKARLASAQERLKRQQSLYDKGLASDQELTDAQAAVRLAEIDVSLARRRRDLVNAGMAEKAIEEAEARLERIRTEAEVLQSQLKRSEELLSRYEIRAPEDATVVRVEKRPGEPVSRGELVLALSPGSERRVYLRVPERDVIKVRPGQKVRFFSQMYPYRQFGAAEGEVYLVEKWAEPYGSGSAGGPSSRGYLVKCYIDSDAPYTLPLGSSVEAEILVGEKPIWKILLGVEELVQDDPKGRPEPKGKSD